ncbi:MAG: phenylalanine--tRNA ligase subunit beta [Candidatus Micrarchaeota archaeon]
MVTTEVSKKYLLKLIGKHLTDEQLEHHLHQIKAPIDSMDGDRINIEVTGDRPDLLSAEGISRALKGPLGIEKGIPEEKFEKGNYMVHVDESVKQVREFIVCAVIENVKLTDEDLKDLIQIQEKLTITHGRKRKKVAIGLHDMESLVAPFYYKAVEPESVEFVPLMENRKMNLRQILEKHPKGIEYGWILKDAKKMPIIFDSRNQVLSFPPIINGILTEMRIGTKTIFIDITGPDYHSCNIALNILCQDFYDRGCTVKSVEVKYPHKTIVTPETEPEAMELKVHETNKLLGISLSPQEIIDALAKQRISAKIKSPAVLNCLIPRYRADFLHPVDLIEEVALGYGYNNFQPKSPSIFTRGSVSRRTKIVDLLTDLMVGSSFMELNTPILTSQKLFDKAKSGEKLILIKNPVSEEYENIRSSLLPHLIDALSKNTHNNYPQKIFEIGLAATEDANSPVSARNDLHVAGIIAHSNANLAELSSSLLEIMRLFRTDFKIGKSELEMFINGRQTVISARINGDTAEIGKVGELSPAVLEAFKLEVPCVGFELNIEKLLH